MAIGYSITTRKDRCQMGQKAHWEQRFRCTPVPGLIGTGGEILNQTGQIYRVEVKWICCRAGDAILWGRLINRVLLQPFSRALLKGTVNAALGGARLSLPRPRGRWRWNRYSLRPTIGLVLPFLKTQFFGTFCTPADSDHFRC